MQRKLIAALIACWAIGASAAEEAAAPQPIKMEKKVPYAPGVGTDGVRGECDFDSELSQFIAAYSKGGVVVSDEALNPSEGSVLTLTIVNVHSIGGGGFTGPKWATVQGELHEGGQVVGSFTAMRRTSGGTLTTCGTLTKIAKSLGKDVSKWLKAPQMNAQLGNEK